MAPRTSALINPAQLASNTVRVSWRAAVRLRAGHPWVYRSDLEGSPSLPRAGVVRVLEEGGRFLGCAISSSSSQIALRMISDRDCDETELPSLVSTRIKAAIEYRNALRIPEQSNAYRLVFSEADQLPGLIVDRYNDVLAFQVLTQAMDRKEVREAIIQTLETEIHPAGIVERVEERIRELEELPAIEAGLIRGDKMQTIIEMRAEPGKSPLCFEYDAAAGQKTGAFLDQRENYAAAQRYAHGSALDVFCYQGGFALHLARACEQVIGVDGSRSALEAGERNFELNRSSLTAPEIEWLEANAFDLLRDWSDTGRKFQTIVLDPPAFAKTKKALPTALRGYKELNLRALKMLEPGGILVTCTCSHHVSQEEFLGMLAESARDAHRRIRLLEVRGQSQDHPVVAGIPETAYLKCVIAFAE
ncbi:MAG: SAM-dependent methyltransferase [Acidobacteria bacterium]|nr:MAG: SAM-dependent methyltransferase [Acidobacteriota bacterium]